MSRYLDPKSDLVFKRIFGDNPNLLKSFLNAVLPLSDDQLIESLEYLPTEHSPVIPILKRTIVDVKCKDQKGRSFVVEMQLEWTHSFMERMLFGTGQAYIKQLGKGENYTLLNPVYGLGILNTVFDKETTDWYHHYQLINVENPKRKIEGLQLVFLELPKFQPKTHADKKLRALWLRFLSEISEETTHVDAALLAVPEINQALGFAEESAYTKSELASYDQYWDSVRTEKTLILGKLAEGEAKATKRIARNLLAAGMTLPDIAKATELTMDELKNL